MSTNAYLVAEEKSVARTHFIVEVQQDFAARRALEVSAKATDAAPKQLAAGVVGSWDIRRADCAMLNYYGEGSRCEGL